METALYWIGRAAIALISCWPLKLIAWLGRRGGGLATDPGSLSSAFYLPAMGAQ